MDVEIDRAIGVVDSAIVKMIAVLIQMRNDLREGKIEVKHVLFCMSFVLQFNTKLL